MRRLLLLALLTCSLDGALSDRIVWYRIRAALDPASKSIAAQETLTWRNGSRDPVGELRFHLYLNAFQNEKSSFMRESGGQLRGDKASKNDWGYIEITRMQISGGAVLTKAIRFIHPDDDNADDQTVIAVPLPKPVAPGQSITLEIDFFDKLPKVFARTGFHDDFFMVGQWFPKIGVLQETGWNCHQFHANSEFFADYGVYDVTLTTPSNYTVGATGVQQSVTEDRAHHSKTYRFYQEDVHDFAWTASPHYIRVERAFQSVRMILLMQPEHARQTERHIRALENGMKWFGLWYGPYPYETITMVDPPHGAEGASGMEYPTLITAGTGWWPGAHGLDPEEVVIHEFGHQYWYGMVGTNEFEEAWLDEGFNTYSTGKVLDVAYGPRRLPMDLLTVPIADFLDLPTCTQDDLNRAVYLQYGKYDPVVRNAWQFESDFSYGVNSYYRAATVLRTLENYLGADVMARIMRTWFTRYRFQHPTSRDFQNLVNEISARDMNWFFDQFVYGTGRLNYKVDSVESQEEGVKLGSYLKDGKRFLVTEESKKKSGKPDYRIAIRLKRDGETVFPVEWKLTLENAESEWHTWDGRDRWVKFEYLRKSPAHRVEIDPGHKILLDTSIADNSWVETPPVLPLAKWTSNLLFWLQTVLP